MLLHNIFSNPDDPLYKQYRQQSSMFKTGKTFILINLNKVFGPYPKNEDVPWNVSEAQMLTQRKDVQDVLKFININLVLPLGYAGESYSYQTVGVLLRIATGMLNKLDIPNEYKLMFHEHMTHNIWTEFGICTDENLPF